MERIQIKYSMLQEIKNEGGEAVFKEAFEANGAIIEVIDDVTGKVIMDIPIEKAVKINVIIHSYASDGRAKFQWLYYSEDRSQGITNVDVGRVDFDTENDAMEDIINYAKEKHLRIKSIVS